MTLAMNNDFQVTRNGSCKTSVRETKSQEIRYNFEIRAMK